MIQNSGASLKLTEKVWEVRTGIKAVFLLVLEYLIFLGQQMRKTTDFLVILQEYDDRLLCSIAVSPYAG